MPNPLPKYIRWFAELGMADVAQVGGKNASLGEIFRELTPKGIRVPNGFAITAQAYRHVLDRAEAWRGLHAALDGLDGLDVRDVDDLARRALQAREIIQGARLPDDLVQEVREAHARLRAEYGEVLTVAVRTGDMGHVDECGCFKITDRKKDMIVVSGFKVFPNQIEDAVALHPGVAEVAAIGAPDEKSGEVVKIIVVKSDPALTEQDLLEPCRKHRTDYKMPRHVEFRTEPLPKTNLGKILRRQLRDESARHLVGTTR